MKLRYFIVDDDVASRKMLAQIIQDEELGVVIGEAESGISAMPLILNLSPDIVLIDLLMPEIDGIETVERLRNEGFTGPFIMISQVESKEMVGEAYEKGVEFFIHKPINRIEVKAVLSKVAERIRLQQSLAVIQGAFGGDVRVKKRSVRDIGLAIVAKMGIVGEAGTDDILTMMELLMKEERRTTLPPLKELYEKVAIYRNTPKEQLQKECKAIEQRIRRALIVAMNHLAALGASDYMNPEFEYYAPRYFEFEEIRKRMLQEEEGEISRGNRNVNIKKFLHMLYLEIRESYNL